MRIGTIQIDSPLCQAGLAGYSDRAMRNVARRRGCPYAVTEAMLDILILQGGLTETKALDVDDEDHPVAGQIMGADPHTMAEGARRMARAGFDVIDVNFACPVKKIASKGRGGHLLSDPVTAKAILAAVRDAVPAHIPCTVKLRRGFDDSTQAFDAFQEVFESAFSLGYAAAAVHARTVMQKYAGPSRWEFLTDLKRRHPGRVIFGSGDVFTPEDALRMQSQTGVDGVWIARGAIGNPWIFGHSAQRMAGVPASDLVAPTVAQQGEALEEHFDLAVQIHGEHLAALRLRKMALGYTRFHPEGLAARTAFYGVEDAEGWRAVMKRWYSRDADGVWPLIASTPRGAPSLPQDLPPPTI